MVVGLIVADGKPNLEGMVRCGPHSVAAEVDTSHGDCQTDRIQSAAVVAGGGDVGVNSMSMVLVLNWGHVVGVVVVSRSNHCRKAQDNRHKRYQMDKSRLH